MHVFYKCNLMKVSYQSNSNITYNNITLHQNYQMLTAGMMMPNQNYSDMLRFNTQTPKNTRSRPKLLMLKQKNTFLTDTQTSDNTKSSNESNSLAIQMLQQKNRKLSKQNNQLKQTIITMKANQFYTVNQGKVKQAIQENQNLKAQIKRLNSVIQQIQLQKYYFVRNNEQLKLRLGESVTKQKSQRMKTQTQLVQRTQRRTPELVQLRQSHKQIRHVTSNPNLLLSYENFDSQFRNQKQNSNSNQQTFQLTYKLPIKSKDHLRNEASTNRQILRDGLRESIKQNRDGREYNRQIKQYKSQSRSRSKDLGGSITNLLKQRRSKKINPQKNKEVLNPNFNQEYFLGSTNQNHAQNNGSITLIRSRSKRY